MERRMRSNVPRGTSTTNSTVGSVYSEVPQISGRSSKFRGMVGGGEGFPPTAPIIRRSSTTESTIRSMGGSGRISTSSVSASCGSRPDRGKDSALYLALCVSMWYALTVMYSVYNAAVLQVFPFPLTVLTAELGAGVLLVLPAWLLGVVRTPSLRISQMPIIFYVALWHSLSNASTGAALRESSLAAVTAVQGLEPLASAAVDRHMGREASHVLVKLCLLPVIGGVMLVSKEASLTWGGLFFAVASSVAVGVRDLYSKRASRQKEFNKRPLSAANTYAVVTVMSFATVVPYTFIVDGPRAIRWWSSFAEESAVATEASAGNGSRGFGELEDVASVPDGSALIFYLAASGVLLFLHSAAAFLVLERVGSVTGFSVANSIKRGVVVLAAAAVTKSPLEGLTIVGATFMIFGACAYWVARMYYPPRRRRKGNLQQ